MRRIVEQMISVGDSKAMICRAIGCTEKTLDLHFEDNLLNGAARKRAWLLEQMYKSAKTSAAVQRQLELITRTVGAANDFDQQTDTPDAPAAPQRAIKRGKKEVQREEAFNAGTNSDWGDDLAPIAGTKIN